MARLASEVKRSPIGGWVEEARLVEARFVHRTEVSHDRLTGLARRATLLGHINHTLDAAAGTTARVGLVACVVHGLDAVEARHGSVVRTEVVVEAAARLRRVVGGEDAPALVAPDCLVAVALCGSTVEVEAAAEAVTRALRAPIPTSVGAVTVGAATRSDLATRTTCPDEVVDRLVGPGRRGRPDQPSDLAALVHAPVW